MKPIGSIDGRNFYVVSDWNFGELTVNITDFKSVWKEKLTEEEVEEKFKKCNPLVQLSRQKMMETISSLILGDCSEIKQENQNLFVQFLRKVGPIRMKFNLTLTLQNPEFFYSDITMPLVVLVNQLIEQQKSLYSLLKAKDVELLEYKLEDHSISRRNVQTDQFTEQEFQNKCLDEFLKKSPDELVETKLNLDDNFSKIFTQTSRQITTKLIMPIKEEDIKKEEESIPFAGSGDIPQQVENGESSHQNANESNIKVETLVKVESKRPVEKYIVERTKKPRKRYIL